MRHELHRLVRMLAAIRRHRRFGPDHQRDFARGSASGPQKRRALRGSTSASTRSTRRPFSAFPAARVWPASWPASTPRSAVGFRKIRLNAVAIRGLTEPDIIPLRSFARDLPLEMRFIEFMPLDAEQNWQSEQVSVATISVPCSKPNSGRSSPPIALIQPARHRLSVRRRPRPDWLYQSGVAAFLRRCNRLRLTAEGQVRNCLFSIEEWDARAVLRGGGTDDDLAALVRESMRDKTRPRHRPGGFFCARRPCIRSEDSGQYDSCLPR